MSASRESSTSQAGGQVSRRQLLVGTTGVTVGLAATGCGFLSTSSDDDEPSAKGDKTAKESPMLADRVKSGTLPALEERLPTKPMVVEPLEETGVHGGTLHRWLIDTADSTGAFSTISRAGLAEFDLRTYEPVPAVAESWQVSNGGATYTFTLRKGLKWSDGEPFTTDDIEFYFSDFLGDTTLNVAPPSWYVIGGKPGTFTKIDETRFKLDFVKPHALLPKYLAFNAIGGAMLMPKHHLSKFLPKYTPVKELTSQAKKAGLASWDLYWVDRAAAWTNPEIPVMGPWFVKKSPGAAGSSAELERNPYYWKVDSDGRQLPYVDTIAYGYTDTKTMPLKAAGGEIDLQFRYINYEMMPTIQKAAEAHNYEVRQWTLDAPWVGLYMNQDNTDPVKRELMRNRDFRAGMSHALNRDEMNQTLFTGLALSTNPGPIKEDPYHIPGYGKTFIEYDVDKANQLLDSVGLDQRDGDGWRLRSDGKTLDISILTFESETGSPIDAYEMVVRYWRAVGIKADFKVVSSQLWRERCIAGQVDVPGYTCAGYLWEIDPQWFVPVRDSSYFAPLAGTWYQTAGAEGEEPPPDLRRLQDLYDQMKVAADDKKRMELGREIIQAHNENVWIMGTVGMPFQPVVVSKDLVNVKPDAVASYRLGQDEVTWFEQVFYRNPEDH